MRSNLEDDPGGPCLYSQSQYTARIHSHVTEHAMAQRYDFWKIWLPRIFYQQNCPPCCYTVERGKRHYLTLCIIRVGTHNNERVKHQHRIKKTAPVHAPAPGDGGCPIFGRRVGLRTSPGTAGNCNPTHLLNQMGKTKLPE